MTMTTATPHETALAISRYFGCTPQQALRVQALIRLGISEDDIRAAEHLMAPRSAADRGAKFEWLLGYTVEQMSYKKALEVLGISEAILNEERAKILGSLGITAWPSNPQPSRGASSGAFFGQQQLCNNDHQGSSVAPCSTIEMNTCVTELEDTCVSQYLRIQQLELQVSAAAAAAAAALTDRGEK